MSVSFYRCDTCGNICHKIFDGGGTLICCGKPMEELKAGVSDAAQEKHVPQISRSGNHLDVQVGSVLHPMAEEHWIVFIAAVQGKSVQIRTLDSGEEPRASFEIGDGEVEVYEFCNKHGLWMAKA